MYFVQLLLFSLFLTFRCDKVHHFTDFSSCNYTGIEIHICIMQITEFVKSYNVITLNQI